MSSLHVYPRLLFVLSSFLLVGGAIGRIAASHSLALEARASADSGASQGRAKAAAWLGQQATWTSIRTLKGIAQSLTAWTKAYPSYTAGFTIQSGAAVGAWGCRPGSSLPLHDADVWYHITEKAMETIISNNGGLKGGHKVPGGWEWPEAAIIGNTHELDMRDGQLAWGNVGVLNAPQYRVDTGLRVGVNAVYVLGCEGMEVQKNALLAQGDCQRAHPPLGTCNNLASQAGRAAVARGQAKKARDGHDLRCVKDIVVAGDCNELGFQKALQPLKTIQGTQRAAEISRMSAAGKAQAVNQLVYS